MLCLNSETLTLCGYRDLAHLGLNVFKPLLQLFALSVAPCCGVGALLQFDYVTLVYFVYCFFYDTHDYKCR